jgi:hypothetical protein
MITKISRNAAKSPAVWTFEMDEKEYELGKKTDTN